MSTLITRGMEEPRESGSYLIWDGPLLLHALVNDDTFDTRMHWSLDGSYWTSWAYLREHNTGNQIEALADRDREKSATAWEEGFQQGVVSCAARFSLGDDAVDLRINPYARTEEHAS